MWETSGWKLYRTKAISKLGGVCQWHEGCTVDNPVMLDIAHTQDDGAKHRAEIAQGLIGHATATQTGKPRGSSHSYRYYKEIYQTAGSGRYILLCKNHHALWDYEKRTARREVVV